MDPELADELEKFFWRWLKRFGWLLRVAININRVQRQRQQGVYNRLAAEQAKADLVSNGGRHERKRSARVVRQTKSP